MDIVVADLEGVFLPEIWINVAEKTGIDQLKLTTRDISDYDELMSLRLKILREHHLTIHDIEKVIDTLSPLPGALDMLNWIRQRTQIIILSDTFQEFSRPLMAKLDFPTLLCHNLSIDQEGHITDYNLRTKDQKTKTVQALRDLNFRVIAFGDSYNDLGMITSAHEGFFFRPPESLVQEYPDRAAAHDYDQVKELLSNLLQS